MANIKQKFIKAGTDFNYSEGVKVKAAETIYKQFTRTRSCTYQAQTATD